MKEGTNQPSDTASRKGHRYALAGLQGRVPRAHVPPYTLAGLSEDIIIEESVHWAHQSLWLFSKLLQSAKTTNQLLSPNGRGGSTPLMPLRGPQETRIATREESGVLGFPSRRGLTPRGSLECNPDTG